MSVKFHPVVQIKLIKAKAHGGISSIQTVALRGPSLRPGGLCELETELEEPCVLAGEAGVTAVKKHVGKYCKHCEVRVCQQTPPHV